MELPLPSASDADRTGARGRTEGPHRPVRARPEEAAGRRLDRPQQYRIWTCQGSRRSHARGNRGKRRRSQLRRLLRGLRAAPRGEGSSGGRTTVPSVDPRTASAQARGSERNVRIGKESNRLAETPMPASSMRRRSWSIRRLGCVRGAGQRSVGGGSGVRRRAGSGALAVARLARYEDLVTSPKLHRDFGVNRRASLSVSSRTDMDRGGYSLRASVTEVPEYRTWKRDRNSTRRTSRRTGYRLERRG